MKQAEAAEAERLKWQLKEAEQEKSTWYWPREAARARGDMLSPL